MLGEGVIYEVTDEQRPGGAVTHQHNVPERWLGFGDRSTVISRPPRP